jgi:hypothetical protein
MESLYLSVIVARPGIPIILKANNLHSSRPTKDQGSIGTAAAAAAAASSTLFKIKLSGLPTFNII